MTRSLVELALECKADSDKYFPFSSLGKCPRDLMHYAVGMSGEAGEVEDIIKKIDRGSLDLGSASVRNHLAEEVTDVLIYILNIAAFLRIDLEKTYERKRNINNARFIASGSPDYEGERAVRGNVPKSSSGRGTGVRSQHVPPSTGRSDGTRGVS